MEGVMLRFNIETGISQGSLLSPILWLVYDHHILRIASDKALIAGYVNDISVLVTGKTPQDN